MKQKKPPRGESQKRRKSQENKDGEKPPPVHNEDSLLSLEYWSNRISEARATMSRALNIDSPGDGEGLRSPSYIDDPLLLLEYWVARSGEARARMEERLALASLTVNMEIALQESNEMLRRLENARESSPQAMDSLMHGRLW